MKWFQHKAKSLHDPFIKALMRRFKHKGYTTYFGMLELITAEIKDLHNNDGIVTLEQHYCYTSLLLSRHKFVEILNFCNNNELAPQRFIIEWHDPYITIKCPKLKEISDNWTARKYGKTTEPLQSNDREATEQLTLKEKEKGKEDDKKNRDELLEKMNKAIKALGLKLKEQDIPYLDEILNTYDHRKINVAWTYLFLKDSNQAQYGYTMKNFATMIDKYIPEATRIIRDFDRAEEKKKQTGEPFRLADIISGRY